MPTAIQRLWSPTATHLSTSAICASVSPTRSLSLLPTEIWRMTRGPKRFSQVSSSSCEGSATVFSLPVSSAISVTSPVKVTKRDVVYVSKPNAPSSGCASLRSPRSPKTNARTPVPDGLISEYVPTINASTAGSIAPSTTQWSKSKAVTGCPGTMARPMPVMPRSCAAVRASSNVTSNGSSSADPWPTFLLRTPGIHPRLVPDFA
ncbi:hypothetical protein D3C81_979250 [compost metagenome]